MCVLQESGAKLRYALSHYRVRASFVGIAPQRHAFELRRSTNVQPRDHASCLRISFDGAVVFAEPPLQKQTDLIPTRLVHPGPSVLNFNVLGSVALE